MGVDRGWRRAAVRLADLSPDERVLDVCAGTGDLSIDFVHPSCSSTLCDLMFPNIFMAH